MRLFIAVDVDEAVRRRAGEVQRELIARHGAAAARGLRWVRPTQMHLTLRFIGEVSDSIAADTIAACRGSIGRPPFEIAFGPVAWLPHAGQPRVLMLPLTGGVDPLQRLKVAVDERLPPGVPAEEMRPFTPHLTLARVRDEFRREVRTLAREQSQAAWAPLATRVTHASLIESRLSPGGPDYTERARVTLGGGDR